MDNKDAIIAFVNAFSTIVLDPDLLDVYYSDVLDELGKYRDPLLVSVELFSITSGTATYAVPSSTVKVQNIFVGSKQLIPCDLSDLESYSDDWRSESAASWAYTVAEQAIDTYRLFPNPAVTSGPIIPSTGSLFGADYPTNIGCWLFSQKRDEDMPEWVSVYIALRVLAKVYRRPSAHRDVRFAEQCDKFAKIILQATGVKQ